MINVGKNQTVVRDVAVPIVPGDNIKVERVPEGYKVGLCRIEEPKVEVCPCQQKESISGLVCGLKECVRRLDNHSDAQVAMGETLASLSDKSKALCNEAFKLSCEVKNLKAQPAKEVVVRVVEKPGVTVHEVVKNQTSWLVWVGLGLILINQIALWVIK